MKAIASTQHPQNNDIEITPAGRELIVQSGEPAIPHELLPFVAEWGNISYQQSGAHQILTQSFTNSLYGIYIYHFVMNEPTELILHCGEALVCMLFGMQGSVRIPTRGAEDLHFESDHFGFTYLSKGRHVLRVSAGISEIFQIRLSPVLLEELAENRQEIKELLDLLEADDHYAIGKEPLPMNYIIRQTLEDMRCCVETGAGLLMEFRVMITNLLNLYRKAFNGQTYYRKLSAHPNKDTLILIRSEIRRAPNIQQHSFRYFSTKYNLSESTLGRAFTTVFGKGLHEFVTEQCMIKADVLLLKSGSSIDDVAFELGYADRSGFLKAYKKFHGITPKQLKH
jgi:AraC-like DNA-binding protein